MKRDWLWIAAGIALGETGAYLLGSVTKAVIITVIIAALVFVLSKRIKKFDRRRAVIITGVAFLCGFLRMGIDDALYPRIVELNMLSGIENATGDAVLANRFLSGIRGSGTEMTENDNVYAAKVDKIELREDKTVLTCGQLLVYVSNDDLRDGLPSIGNTIKISGSFAPMDRARNPGGFDYRIYYRSVGITHRCFAENVRIIGTDTDFFRQTVFEIRQYLLNIISERFPENDAAFLRAALLGDKSGIDDDIYDMYRRNGIAHLLAISGLHVAVLGMGLYDFLRRLGLSYLLSGIMATVFLIFYTLLTGGSVSVVRAAVMLIMIFTAGCLGRRNDILNSAGVAASALMLFRPYEIFSCGFLLSFGAVIAIGGPAATIIKRLGLNKPGRDSGESMKSYYFDNDVKHVKRNKPVDEYSGENRFEKALRTLASTFITSLSIQLVTLPVMAYFFFEIPLYGVFINLIVVPLMTYVLVSGLLSFLIGWAAGAAHYLLEFYSILCSVFDRLPCHTILIGRPAIWQIVIYYFCFFALLYLYPSVREKLKSRFST